MSAATVARSSRSTLVALGTAVFLVVFATIERMFFMFPGDLDPSIAYVTCGSLLRACLRFLLLAACLGTGIWAFVDSRGGGWRAAAPLVLSLLAILFVILGQYIWPKSLMYGPAF